MERRGLTAWQFRRFCSICGGETFDVRVAGVGRTEEGSEREPEHAEEAQAAELYPCGDRVAVAPQTESKPEKPHSVCEFGRVFGREDIQCEHDEQTGAAHENGEGDETSCVYLSG